MVRMDLWSLTLERTTLDPEELASAIESQLSEPRKDYRTRQLICESLEALRSFWGEDRFRRWQAASPHREEIARFLGQSFPEVGFPSLSNRLQVTTRPETIRQYLRELGTRLTTGAEVVIGGSSSLILAGLLQRTTEDIDVVDEVPEPVRTLHGDLNRLRDRYGLVMAHFQSHFLPSGWEGRLRSLGSFGHLSVKTVDPVDVAAGKLLSRREKDLDDLRVLVGAIISKQELATRLLECEAHLRDPKLRENAERNWYILFGEDSLPSVRV